MVVLDWVEWMAGDGCSEGTLPRVSCGVRRVASMAGVLAQVGVDGESDFDLDMVRAREWVGEGSPVVGRSVGWPSTETRARSPSRSARLLFESVVVVQVQVESRAAAAASAARWLRKVGAELQWLLTARCAHRPRACAPLRATNKIASKSPPEGLDRWPIWKT